MRPGLQHFRDREDGGGTVFALFMLVLMLAVVGLAVDTANLHRNRMMLQGAADAAAAAGVVALTHGATADEAREVTRLLVEANMPRARFGSVIDDPAIDLQVLSRAPGQDGLAAPAEDAPPNTVVVRLQRTEAAGNPLPTLLMQFVGLRSWSLSATAVATVTPTRRCGNAEGIVARGRIDLGRAPLLGEGLCLHSQTAIALGPATRAAEDLRLSLPDPQRCEGVCDPRAAGAVPALPLNYVGLAAEAHVGRLALGFLDPDERLAEEEAFFATRPLPADLEALREIGLPEEEAAKVVTGDVIVLSALQFSQMRMRPAGLVYEVFCDTQVNDRRPLWQRSISLMGIAGGPALKDIVLVTDCALEMDAEVRIEGSLVLMVGPEDAAIAVEPGARFGGPAGQCDPARRARLMALGSLALPAGLAASNLTVVAGGDVLLLPGEGIAPHQGLVIHAGGAVLAEGSHAFERCPDGADPLLPALEIIARIMPPLGDVLPAIRKPLRTDMPGTAVERLPMTGG